MAPTLVSSLGQDLIEVTTSSTLPTARISRLPCNFACTGIICILARYLFVACCIHCFTIAKILASESCMRLYHLSGMHFKVCNDPFVFCKGCCSLLVLAIPLLERASYLSHCLLYSLLYNYTNALDYMSGGGCLSVVILLNYFASYNQSTYIKLRVR